MNLVAAKGKFLVYDPAALTVGKVTACYWIGECVSPKGGVDDLNKEELFPPTGIRAPDPQIRSQITVPTIASYLNS